MRVTCHRTASDFLAHTQPLLERRESFNCLMLGICATLIEAPATYSNHFLWTVDNGEGIKVVALLTPPYEPIIYAESIDMAAISLLAAHLHDQEITLPGVVGAVDTAHAFAEAWANVTGESWLVRRHSRVYDLRQVLFPVGVQGRSVQAATKHLPVIASWIQEFHHGNLSMKKAERIADSYVADQTMSLWEVDGEPVSMAVGPTRQSRRCGMISYVYTPPEYRRQGYASAVVAAVSQRILDSGKAFCVLFTNLANPTSNSIYQKIGYTPCGDFDELKFGRNWQ